MGEPLRHPGMLLEILQERGTGSVGPPSVVHCWGQAAGRAATTLSGWKFPEGNRPSG